MNRGRGLAIIGLLVGAGLALMCYLPIWASFVHGQSDIFKTVTSVTGRQYSPLAFALGLVVLAGSVAVWALPGLWVRIAGVVLVVASGYMILTPIVFRADPAMAAAMVLVRESGKADSGVFIVPVTVTWWWLPALIGAVMAFAAAVLVTLHRGHWGGFSARYERAGDTTAPSAAASRTATWDALDRGADPTVAPEDVETGEPDPAARVEPAEPAE